MLSEKRFFSVIHQIQMWMHLKRHICSVRPDLPDHKAYEIEDIFLVFFLSSDEWISQTIEHKQNLQNFLWNFRIFNRIVRISVNSHQISSEIRKFQEASKDLKADIHSESRNMSISTIFEEDSHSPKFSSWSYMKYTKKCKYDWIFIETMNIIDSISKKPSIVVPCVCLSLSLT